MQILVPWTAPSTDLSIWERRPFAAGVDLGPTNRDRRANLERLVAVEARGDPEPDGPFRRAADAILRYDIFPPRLATKVLRRERLQTGDTVGMRYHLLPGVDLFFASRIVY